MFKNQHCFVFGLLGKVRRGNDVEGDGDAARNRATAKGVDM